MTRWLRSIDGNHQWMGLSPKDLLVDSSQDTGWDYSANYIKNYSPITPKSPSALELSKINGFLKGFRPNAGMKLFANESLQKQVFAELFLGPMSPALFNLDNNFPDIIPDQYHYKPSYANPFPILSE